ncbi:hypothetical protein GJU39_19455 [Pedobacter petrophilus]|uniref:Uncharacterized protein n=1 Tax=Pedobacter petrophilus TaxID=1908241 RepID=A0A7K0G372_9SPHI|nr:DUF2683 family protein [Pedobacter petrophilus]MRX78263.1 hypothetical protein [Pedobacter petrophilus]
MEALVVYPENKEQLEAVKAVMKSMNVAFEQKTEKYPSYVVEELTSAIQQVNEGKIHPYTNLRDLIKK